MLRTMDCRLGSERPRRGAVVVAVLLAIVGLATTALRGDAEDATRGDAKPAASLQSQTSQTSSKLFRRPALDFSIIGDNQAGAFVVRVGEILDQPTLRAFIESELIPAKKFIERQWTQGFGAAARPPDIHFDAIDYVAGIGIFAIKSVKPEHAQPGMTRWTMFDSEETVIRFKQPVAWKEWIHDHIPGAVEKSAGGVTYVELPVIKAFGLRPMCVVARDAQTIVLVTDPDRVATASDPAPRPAKSPLAARWAELDGGLATFIATDASIDAPESAPTKPDIVLGEKILASSRLLGAGFDVDPQTRVAAYRIQLTCDNHEAAKELRSTFESLLVLAKVDPWAKAAKSATSTSVDAPPAAAKPEEADDELAWNQFRTELISNCQVKVWQHPDGAAGIIAETSATLPDLAVTAVSVARENAPEDTLPPK